MQRGVPSTCQGVCRVHMSGVLPKTRQGVLQAHVFMCAEDFWPERSKSLAQHEILRQGDIFVQIFTNYLYLRIHR